MSVIVQNFSIPTEDNGKQVMFQQLRLHMVPERRSVPPTTCIPAPDTPIILVNPYYIGLRCHRVIEK